MAEVEMEDHWRIGFTVNVWQNDLGDVKFNSNEQRYAFQHDEGHPYDYANGHKGTPHLSYQQIADGLNHKNIEADRLNRKVTKDKYGREIKPKSKHGGDITASTIFKLVTYMKDRIQNHPEKEDDHWGRVTRPYDLEFGDMPTVFPEER